MLIRASKSSKWSNPCLCLPCWTRVHKMLASRLDSATWWKQMSAVGRGGGRYSEVFVLQWCKQSGVCGANRIKTFVLHLSEGFYDAVLAPAFFWDLAVKKRNTTKRALFWWEVIKNTWQMLLTSPSVESEFGSLESGRLTVHIFFCVWIKQCTESK